MADWPTSASRRIPPVASSSGSSAGAGSINRVVFGLGDGLTQSFVLAPAAGAATLVPTVTTPVEQEQVAVYLGTVLQPNPYETIRDGTLLGSQTTAGETITSDSVTSLRAPYVWAAAGHASYAAAAAAADADWDPTSTGTTTLGVELYFIDPVPNGVSVSLVSHI